MIRETVIAGVLAGAVSARGELVWENTRQAVTAVPGKITGNAVFTCRNNGDEPVAIAKISSSCSCGVAVVSREMLMPRGEATLTVVLTPHGESATAETLVTVTTHDGRQQVLDARLVPAALLLVRPPFAIWQHDSESAAHEFHVTTSSSLPPGAKLRVTSTDPAFKIEVEPLLMRNEWRVLVRPESTSRQRMGTLTFELPGNPSGGRTTAYARVQPPRPAP